MAQPLSSSPLGPGGTPRRRRSPRVVLTLVVVLVLAPLAELFAIIGVGKLIGLWPTVLLLVLESVIGAWVVRREGSRAWAALTDALRGGRMPARELEDGALVLVGGVLLLLPGFITDIVGFLVILPLTRPLARRVLGAAVSHRLLGVMGGGAGREVVDGQVIDATRRPGGHPGGPTGAGSASSSTAGGGYADPDAEVIEGEIL